MCRVKGTENIFVPSGLTILWFHKASGQKIFLLLFCVNKWPMGKEQIKKSLSFIVCARDRRSWPSCIVWTEIMTVGPAHP